MNTGQALGSQRRPGWRQRLPWALLLGSAVFLVGLLAWVYYRGTANDIRRERHADLAAIATIKAQEITNWRQERRTDAMRLAQSLPVRRAIAAAPPADAVLWAELRARLQLELDTADYIQALVAAPDGRVLLAVPEPFAGDAAALRQLAAAAVASRAAVLSDLHRCPALGIHLGAAAAVRGEDGKPLAVVVVSASAAASLYALIQSWPTASASAEVLLVRGDGDEVLYLNDLRHQRGMAFTLREPCANVELPAVQAVLGRTGLFEGRDYRGEQVLADLRPIPGTPWFMVAKVDTDEILSEVHYRAVMTIIVAVLLILALTGLTAYVYRTRQTAERRRAAAQLRDSEERFRALFDNSLAGIALHEIVTDAGGRPCDYIFLQVNAAFEKQSGLAAANLVGRRITEVMPGVSDAPFLGVYGGVALTGKPVRFEHYVPQLERHFDITAFSPKPRQFATVFFDITDRRKMEEELRRRNEEVIRFAYTVSHDLKSPLVTIRTFLGYLLKDVEKADAARINTDMTHMQRAAERMSRLLDELLELSRVGRKMNPPEDVSLQTLASEALELVAGRLSARQIHVRVTDTPVILRGDRQRLVELFQNLLDNAAKFMGDQAAPRIEIGVEGQGQDQALFVRDNGVGIDPRHQHKLFGLFEKLHPETEGTGIGLALVKRIVEVHGGRVWAESAGVGHGTTFRFTLANTRCAPPSPQPTEP